MNLTDAQKLVLKNDILADPVLNAFPLTTDGAYEISQRYDLVAVPDFIVWRTSVSVQQIMDNGYLWTYVDNMTVGKARIWEWMTQYGSINPSKANVRAGIDECYKGTQLALDAKAAVLVHCKRSATRAEKLFAAGTGSDASPAIMAFEGSLFYLDVWMARQMQEVTNADRHTCL